MISFSTKGLNMFARSFLLIINVLLLFGCEFKTKNSADEVSQNLINNVVETTVAQMELPVYNFEDFEEMLHRSDEKIYIINFWATWCKPCIEELPYFERINKEQKENGVEVVLVSLDMPKMWKSRLIPFVKKKELKSKVIILDDPKQNDWIPKVNEEWSGSIPATLIYNKAKRGFFEKGFTYEALNEELKKYF